MIDLRSDTLTRPTDRMRKAMYLAEVGDEGQIQDGRGEDPTVNKLEGLAASLTGKEDALYCCSGTLANIVALLTHCKRGDYIAIGEKNHIHRSEKSPFMDAYFGLKEKFYIYDEDGIPKNESVISLLKEKEIKLLCLENSNSFSGGTCMTVEQTNFICALAKEHQVPIHLDGARIFNVAAYTNEPMSSLVSNVDTVMFCLSKGLGAPIGSMLCGSSAFIRKARETRKFLGGSLRQAGIVAAAGIVSLEDNPQKLHEDNENAALLASKILHNIEVFTINIKTVQTNMIMLDVSPSGYSAEKFRIKLEEEGLRSMVMSDRHVRLMTSSENTRVDIINAAHIINECCKKIKLT